MIDISKHECAYYLILRYSVVDVHPINSSFSTRNRFNIFLRKLGFLPYVKGLKVCFIYSKDELETMRKKIKSAKFELPIEVSLFSIAREDHKSIELFNLKQE